MHFDDDRTVHLHGRLSEGLVETPVSPRRKGARRTRRPQKKRATPAVSMTDASGAEIERWDLTKVERSRGRRSSVRHYQFWRRRLLDNEYWLLNEVDPEELLFFTQRATELGDDEVLACLMEADWDSLPSGVTLPDWLQDLWRNFKCSIIEEQRLLTNRGSPRRHDYGDTPFTRVVTTFSADIKEQISDHLNNYATSSQKLDRSFPNRVIGALKDEPPSVKEVRAKLTELSDKARRLQLAGLLDEAPSVAEELTYKELRRKTVRRILAPYITDTASKLNSLDRIYRKIKLFESLLNDHFSHNEVAVSRQAGLRFMSPHGGPISPSTLSSGEQHIVVLFFRLLFGDLSSGHLVLIDEPELSLHPRWQLRFIDDLQQIRSLVECDFILATHSPEIAATHRHLMRELAGGRG